MFFNEQNSDAGDFGKDLSSMAVEVPKADGTCSEITVTIKDEEKTLKTKFLIYDKFEVHHNDLIIKDCVARSLRDFGSEPCKIKVRINLDIL